jgi:hypothetical protein
MTLRKWSDLISSIPTDAVDVATGADIDALTAQVAALRTDSLVAKAAQGRVWFAGLETSLTVLETRCSLTLENPANSGVNMIVFKVEAFMAGSTNAQASVKYGWNMTRVGVPTLVIPENANSTFSKFQIPPVSPAKGIVKVGRNQFLEADPNFAPLTHRVRATEPLAYEAAFTVTPGNHGTFRVSGSDGQNIIMNIFWMEEPL